MKTGKWAAIALVGISLPLAAVRAEDFRETAKDNIRAHTKEGDSPFRREVKGKFHERKGKGQKIPADAAYPDPILLADEDGLDEDGQPMGWGPGDCEDKKRCPKKGYVVKFKLVTTLKYSGPNEVYDEEPGAPRHKKARWPKPEVQRKVKVGEEWVPAVDENGNPIFDDYTAEYKRLAEETLAKAAELKDRPLWKVDPENPDDPGLWEFGLEPLEEDVTEEITFTFAPEDQAQGKAFFRSLAAAMAAGDVSAEKAVLMGFTYQGPNIDYTIGSTKKACLPIVGCATLWDIKAGFALDFGLGLRLPARSTIYGPPQMIAGQTSYFTSVIDTSGTNGDWNAATFDAAAVKSYAERGAVTATPPAPETDGNEFVMYFEFFAGAKVKIAGVNVCPYCQYVEVNIDYSASFPTPVGQNESFPLPDVRFPIKTFEYGIVSLLVGLKVAPDLGSYDISAGASVLSPGALVTGVLGNVPHGSSGAASTFGVPACIEKEAGRPRYATISLDDYRYNFNKFLVTLGAYMNFSVGGYGVWNPEFDFMTLNLSSALGSLDVYLPDHKTCNFAFQCSHVPASQGVSLQAEVLDQSAPSTSLSLPAQTGLRGWYATDVTGTLTASDNPQGCGAGVSTTSWNVDGGAFQATNPFTLTKEGKLAVTYASTDKDGNAEVVRAQNVWIDKTPPTITGAATTLPNARGWYNSNVVVHFVPGDATSGVYASTPDTTLSAEARDQWVEGTVEDFAGWTRSVVVGGINIDKTAPDIQITLPDADDQYEADGVYTFAWTITDGLSGELSRASTLDGSLTAPVVDPNRTPIVSGASLDFGYLSGGVHELLVTATDNADNVATSTVRFVVDVDIDGLIHATDLMCTGGFLSRGACKSLMVKAQQAKRALDAGQTNAARGVLLGYKQELVALRGKGVKEDAFVLLYADVQYVLRRYGLIGTT